MKFTTVALALATSLLLDPLGTSASEVIPKGVTILTVDVAAPKTKFTDSDGMSLGVSDFVGKIIVLNLWATWCGPCIKEMPSLDRLFGKVDRRNTVVIAVSQDSGGVAVAQPFLQRIGINNLATYADPARKLWRDFEVRGLPTTFVISPNGMIVARVEGAIEWDDPNVMRLFKLER